MKEIMPIFDYFELPETGVIVSGRTKTFDGISNEDIKALFSSNIVIELSDGREIAAHIDTIDVSRSLIDQVNVSLCLGKSVRLSDLAMGAKVFALNVEEKNNHLQTALISK